MRGRAFVLALAALPFGLTACGSGSTTTATGTATVTPTPTNGPWVRYQSGNPTAPPGGSYFTGTPPPALPSVSFLSMGSGCAVDWPDTGQVFIPMNITPITGGFKVEWPSAYGSYYRLAAVRQLVVAGPQPSPSWQTVPAGTGCTTTATITGLTSGAPYIVWLDAPDTPRRIDGSRSLYSGRSGVLIVK
ncbi:hypothetical protein ODJ79_38850 [Actinoplanes sp. KI2]|uniref:hypothetical protein n=1 Tax=Actinoplanes sp. KI2 TaxID=2983315 RepID=UPI0021D60971|nr:hypothetical protein [Actinoplanes sp. KI2]MCU7729712.1 hypothetical protein [Actinoplanes sp. KI2]